jgi:hypothetical protein
MSAEVIDFNVERIRRLQPEPPPEYRFRISSGEMAVTFCVTQEQLHELADQVAKALAQSAEDAGEPEGPDAA